MIPGHKLGGTVYLGALVVRHNLDRFPSTRRREASRSKISDFEAKSKFGFISISAYENVGRLEGSVNDVLIVEVTKTSGDFSNLLRDGGIEKRRRRSNLDNEAYEREAFPVTAPVSL